jgi:PAS domain S-box-containing protein
LAVATHQILTGHESQRAAAQFDEHLAERSFALELEVNAVLEALHSLRALYDASEEVTREEFATFVRVALSRHSSIQAMEWVPRVPEKDREAHEARGRAAGLEGYVITDCREHHPPHRADAQMEPSPGRPEYFPVFFVEPYEGNENALGFDLGSDEVRRAALDRATETGRVTLTDPIVLVQEKGTSKGVLALLPVHERSRAADVKGFVVVVFRVADVVRQARREREGLPARMLIELTCADAQGGRQVLYDSAGVVHDVMAAAPASVKRIRVGGEVWHLAGSPTGAFLSQRLTLFPVAMAAGVFVLVGVLGGFVFTLAKRSRDLALGRQDRTIRAVLGSLAEGVVVADKEGRILLANEAAKRAVRMGADVARPGHWADVYGCYLPDMETPFPEQDLPLARAIRGETVTEQDIFVRHSGVPEGLWLRVNSAPVSDEKGELLGGVVTLRDVTRRVQSEELVRRLSSAVEQTADAVFITGRDGKILYVNPAFESTTGYASEDVLGKTPRVLKSGEHDREHYQRLWGTILRGEVFRSTTVNRKKSGEFYYAEQTITPMKDPAGRVTHFVAVCKDMTERRRIQEQAIEMRLAAVVQRQLYPELPLEVPGLDLAGAVFPAEATCGDYFDYIPMGNDRIAVVIGDVSGHGMAPALVMAQTRAYLRAFAQTEQDAAAILAKVNRALFGDLRRGFFVTLLLAVLDLASRRLVYASAGHTPGLILNAHGEVKRALTRTGIPLGVDAGSRYELAEDVALEPGEVVVLVTDGVTESRSPRGEFFGEEGVLAAVRSARHGRAHQIVGQVHEAVGAFRAGLRQRDDITMVVCKLEALPET